MPIREFEESIKDVFEEPKLSAGIDVECREEFKKLRTEFYDVTRSLKKEIEDLKKNSMVKGTETNFQLFGEFRCKICGLTLEGHSATAAKTQVFTHSFGASTRLNGESCPLRGKRFYAPEVYMKMLDK